MKKSFLTIPRRNALAGVLFISPFILGFILFFLKPMIQSVRFVFEKVGFADGGGFSEEWIGLENLRYIFTEDPDFNKALVNSLLQMLYLVPIVLIAALFFAIIINQKFFGRTLVRAIFFLPVIITSGVIMSIIKGDAFASSLITSSEGMQATETAVSATSFGLQELLINMGLNSTIVEYFTTISSSLFDLMWRTGIQMIIFLAGLQSIPSTLYEASAMEGASAWENFWMITFPMLTPMLMVNLVYTVIDCFTDGTNEVMNLIMVAGKSHKFAESSAMSWVYFLIVACILGIVAAIYGYSQRRNKSYGG